MNNIICGLDMSLTGTGVVFLDKNKNIINQTLITSSSKEENTPRLVKISMQILSKIEIFKPNLVILEGPAFGIQKTISMFQLGELAGMTKEKLFILNIPFIIVPPTQLKKFITGKGNAKKDLMLLAVHKKFGVDFEDDNLCDAYALARYGFQFLNPTIKRRVKI